jgi:hypothetical protein
MTEFWIVGRGRLANAIKAADALQRVKAISARAPEFATYLKEISEQSCPILIAARDATAPPKFNVRIASKLARQAQQAGIPPNRIFHAGSYAAGSSRQGPYEMEKRMLETDALSGELLGCVLRLPIILIPDARFHAILAPIAWAIQAGMIDPDLQVPLLRPDVLANKLCALPDQNVPVSIVRARARSLKTLIRGLRITPTEPEEISAHLQMLIDYSHRLGIPGSPPNHYDTQMAAATI